MTKYTIESINEIALLKKGKCLSKKYEGYGKKLKWQCKKGHTWLRPLRDTISRNSWCEKCEKQELNLLFFRKCKKIATTRGGVCLSKKYLGSSQLLKWKCKNNHTWKSSFTSTRRGSWCIKCYYENNKKKSLQECHKQSNSKKIICLSKEYKGVFSRVKWQCLECNNVWKARLYIIKQSATNGCPSCAAEKNKKGNDIHKCHESAESLGGKCLDTIYEHQYVKMNWQCAEGHTWKGTYKQVKKGRWCLECRGRKNRGQTITRLFLEKKLNISLKSIFPDWLRNPLTGRKMEVDGFNEEFGIGFEYQGFQHYKFHKFIHKNIENFQALKIRDRAKKKIFKQRGLKLLIIKEFDTNWSNQKIEAYLEKEFSRQFSDLRSHPLFTTTFAARNTLSNN